MDDRASSIYAQSAENVSVNVTTLMYHDVVDPADFSGSGFCGNDANSYKITYTDFVSHILALKSTRRQCVTVSEVRGSHFPPGFLLTFDDGGASAMRIADTLDSHAMRGHFFVATDYVDTPGFLQSSDISELSKRGHIIGSHSASHPKSMNQCSPQQLYEEWHKSVQRLSSLTGHKTEVGSIPNGSFARSVVVAAEQAGMRALFTSEPTTKAFSVGECHVFGRFTIRRQTSPRVVIGLTIGSGKQRMRQWLAWNTRKVAKRYLGHSYDRIRRHYFETL
jgi:peptidoglycan/xylan/chitin deacetylase (PgdA/CDA1 family)